MKPVGHITKMWTDDGWQRGTMTGASSVSDGIVILL